MRLYIFRSSATRRVEAFGSRGASLVQLLRGAHAVTVTFLRLEPDGALGRHPAKADQLLLVVEGSGWVSGAGDYSTGVAAGAMVFWSAGESHETRAGGDGLTALVVEGEGLAPDDTLQGLTLKGI
jgi:quercetin dioxygenase-like cupin family protein